MSWKTSVQKVKTQHGNQQRTNAPCWRRKPVQVSEILHRFIFLRTYIFMICRGLHTGAKCAEKCNHVVAVIATTAKQPHFFFRDAIKGLSHITLL